MVIGGAITKSDPGTTNTKEETEMSHILEPNLGTLIKPHENIRKVIHFGTKQKHLREISIQLVCQFLLGCLLLLLSIF